jgi:enoyl-CoA hydratase/carnithine racemase
MPIDGPFLEQISLHPHPLDKELEFLHVMIPEQHPHVTVVALGRPRKRNAINSKMWKEIGRIFSTMGRLGDGCRAVLLVGNGKAFCAGIDVTDPNFLPAATDGDVARTGLAFLPKLLEMQDCFTALEECPVPVVAAIHGRCVGAGVDLICCADVRLCSDDAVFAVKEVALGLAADIGTLQRLPKITGNHSAVRELCLTGRDFAASTAAEIGLVSRVVQRNRLLPIALNLCVDMARHSPVAVQGTKKALLYARDHTVADGLEQIASYNALALQGQDLDMAWTAHASQAEPTFPNLPPHSRL